MDPQWLQWAKELQAIAQIGLTYSSTSHFDVERYSRIREIAAEILASSGDVGSDEVLEVLQREEGYATPKVDVRGVVFRDGEILLVRETSDGRWTLPGGWADVNQTARDAVVREVFEESGYRVAPSKLLAVFDRSRHEHTPSFPFHVYKIFILCRLIDGEPTTSYETSAVGFFAEDAVPELSTSRVTVAQIRRMFEHLREPDLPTDFD